MGLRLAEYGTSSLPGFSQLSPGSVYSSLATSIQLVPALVSSPEPVVNPSGVVMVEVTSDPAP